jgi:hypothetical protein
MIFERYFQPPLAELLGLMKDKYLRIDYHYLRFRSKPEERWRRDGGDIFRIVSQVEFLVFVLPELSLSIEISML